MELIKVKHYMLILQINILFQCLKFYDAFPQVLFAVNKFVENHFMIVSGSSVIRSGKSNKQMISSFIWMISVTLLLQSEIYQYWTGLTNDR